MTTPLIPRPAAYCLPIALDGDLAIDFRNRDPEDPEAYLDYPAGVVGVFTIYADLKTAGAERIIVTTTPTGHHIFTKVPASKLNGLKDGTLFGFRLAYLDDDFTDGTYDKSVIAGYIERTDGKKPT